MAFDPDLLAALRAAVSAVSIDETETRAEIAHAHETWGRVVCPHTAVALAAAPKFFHIDLFFKKSCGRRRMSANTRSTETSSRGCSRRGMAHGCTRGRRGGWRRLALSEFIQIW